MGNEAHRGNGTRGIGHIGNRDTGANGVQGVWGIWAIRPTGGMWAIPLYTIAPFPMWPITAVPIG